MVRLCLEFLSLADLLRVRSVSRELSVLAREAVRSPEWLRQPVNLEAVQLASWADGCYKHRSFGHTALADVFCVSISNNVLASGGLDRRAQLWNLETASCVSLMHTSPVRCVALHGDHLATGCDEGIIRFYAVRTGSLRGEVCARHYPRASSRALSTPTPSPAPSRTRASPLPAAARFAATCLRSRRSSGSRPSCAAARPAPRPLKRPRRGAALVAALEERVEMAAHEAAHQAAAAARWSC